jgi:hypothetical protein
MADIPQWWMKGTGSTCEAVISLSCEFAQPPTNNHCDGVLAYHIREGAYGDVRLDGLNVLAVGQFDGNIWAGEARLTLGLYIDARGDERRAGTQRVFSGQAGGFVTTFAGWWVKSEGLSSCRSPLKWPMTSPIGVPRSPASGRGRRALSGPTTPPGRVNS